MIKVLANDGISQSGKEALESAGFFVETQTVAQENLIQEINEKDYKVLLVRSATKVRKDIIDACHGLEMIGRGGVGMDNIDVAYAREQGKIVFNTPASSSQAVAELAMAHMYNLARMLYDADRKMPNSGVSDFKNLKKQYSKGFELRGKTLAIVGFGRIGQSLAQYALGNGMHVVSVTRESKNFEIDLQIPGLDCKAKLTSVGLSEALPKADFISLHVPAQKDGSAVIGSAELASMKKGACIVNMARGGVIDEDALLEALNSGQVGAAGLDVFVNEPTPRADVLAHPKVCSTPHIGGSTVEAQDRIGDEIADIIIAHYKK